MRLSVWIFLAVLMSLVVFSGYRFYKEKAYKVMLGFLVCGGILAYYFKGLTEAKLALGGGIGTEGLFVAITVMIIFILDGIIAQFLSIALKKPRSRNSKIALSIGGIFIILSSLSSLLKLL